jgi:hypothetical protein
VCIQLPQESRNHFGTPDGIISNSSRLKEFRNWDRWNIFQRWVGTKNENFGGGLENGLGQRYKNLARAELGDFNQFYSELCSSVAQ